MRPPPSPALLPHYPVTGGVGLLALAATLLWWRGGDVSFLLENYLVWRWQPWRLFTSALPHVNLYHLIFNLYWLWVFGTLVEDVFGHWRTLVLMLFLAAGSGMAEYAFFEGGVGLSGVGYGLFGLLWVLSSRDQRFEEAIDKTTVILFVAWFFLCCILTALHIWNVGNVAHGAGGVLGALLGLVIAECGRRRLALLSLLAVLTAMLVVASSVGRPYVNLSSVAGEDFAHLAYEEHEKGNYQEAVTFYQMALRYNPQQASWWFNLGIAYQHQGNMESALHAYEKAVALDPKDARYRFVCDTFRSKLAK